jgi:hypothetical protein
LIKGKPYKFNFGFFEMLSANTLTIGDTYNVKLQVNNFTLYDTPFVATGSNFFTARGLNIDNTTARVVFTL